MAETNLGHLFQKMNQNDSKRGDFDLKMKWNETKIKMNSSTWIDQNRQTLLYIWIFWLIGVDCEIWIKTNKYSNIYSLMPNTGGVM